MTAAAQSFIQFNPLYGVPMAWQATLAQFREVASGCIWRFSPWDGQPRAQADIDSDPHGQRIPEPPAALQAPVSSSAEDTELGRFSITQNIVDQVCLALAKKLDVLIREAINVAMRGERWALADLPGRLEQHVLPNDTRVIRLDGKAILVIYPMELGDDALKPGHITAGFRHKMLIDAEGNRVGELPAGVPE